MKELGKIPDIEIFPKPQICIIAFRLKPKQKTDSELNLLNKEFLEHINKNGRLMLTGAEIKGRFMLRIVPFGHRTHRSHVDEALKVISSSAKM